jgi:RNA polymerase sigma factor (TIGR02999 family)
MQQDPMPSERMPDSQAESARWLPEVYDELRRIAASQMSREASGLTLQPTALVHEAWLKLSNSDDGKWNDREHFFRYAALTMRRILVESARRKRERRSDLHSLIEAETMLGNSKQSPEDHLQRIDECLQILEQRDPESARVVILKFYGGLTNPEVARALGMSERSVERQWAYAKSALLAMIRKQENSQENP